MFQLEHFVRTGLSVRYLGSSEQGARNQPFADGLGVLSSPSATSSSRAFSTGFHSYRARAALDKGGFRYPRSKFVCRAGLSHATPAGLRSDDAVLHLPHKPCPDSTQRYPEKENRLAVGLFDG